MAFLAFLGFLVVTALVGAVGAPVVYNEPIWLAWEHLQADLTHSYLATMFTAMSLVGAFYVLSLLDALAVATFTHDARRDTASIGASDTTVRGGSTA